ncbi:N-acetylglucosamine kinase [Streptomyces sp. NBC_00316]|uniref:N-acetylglucosamine kinase n=1 Tax=Streptomyces sp. NBC_00316 TaxID=2975710 RepID=UPI002E2E010A|nr:BadF/BadG/BcrA/BcrD ATPase family protein [Streptomyces sp. NBC_00316]
MISESIEQRLVIGIDAGGSRTRAYCADANGNVIGTGADGPGNPLGVRRADLVRHLTRAMESAVPAGLRGSVVAVAGGFAGAGPGRGRNAAVSCLAEALAALGIDDVATGVYGDAEVAFASGPGMPADGLILIAGTGAVAGRVRERRCVRTVDGHGWLLGDEGSGFWLGRQAVRIVVQALDGRGPWGPLARLVVHEITPGRPGSTPSPAECDRLRAAVADWAYSGPPVALARLSPLVVAAGAEGDQAALSLLDRAADELAGKVGALAPRGGEVLVTTGGLICPEGPLAGRLADRVESMGLRIAAVQDGAIGAVALARLLTT